MASVSTAAKAVVHSPVVYPSPRVLVVTADPVLAYTRAALVQAAGFSSEIAPNTKSALQRLRDGSFDLVMLGHEFGDEPGHKPDENTFEQDLHESFPGLIILKIDRPWTSKGKYVSLITDGTPSQVVGALRSLLGDFSPAPFH